MTAHFNGLVTSTSITNLVNKKTEKKRKEHYSEAPVLFSAKYKVC